MMFKAKIAAIEIAGDEARVAVAKVGGKQPVVVELLSEQAVYETPEERFEALVTALDTVLERMRSRPSAYVLCASMEQAMVRNIRIPFRGQRKVAAAVPFELEPHLAFPIEDLAVDFNIVGEAEGETDVLAIGMHRERLEEQLALLEAVGVKAEAVSLDAVALTGMWQALGKKNKGVRAVLHVRERVSYLAVTYRNALAFLRLIPYGEADFETASAGVTREVQNSIRAFEARWRMEESVEQLAVTGVDWTPEVTQAFSASIGFPVETLSMMPQLKGGALALAEGAGGVRANRWEAMLGTALGTTGKGLCVDFVQGTRAWEDTLRSVIPHVLFSSCLALLILVGWAFYYQQGTSRNLAEKARLQEEVDTLTAEIDAMAEQGLGADLTMDAFEAPTLLDLLKDIAARMPEDKVELTEMQMHEPGARGSWLRIRGSVDDSALFNDVFEELKQSPLYVVEENPDMSAVGGKTTFEVKAFKTEEGTDETEL